MTGKRKNPLRGRLVAKARGESLINDTSRKESVGVRGSKTQMSASISESFSDSGGSSSSSSVTEPISLSLLSSFASATKYKPDFFFALLPQFEELVYPFSPAMSAKDIVASVSAMYDNFENAALVYAYAAATTFLSQTSDTLHGDVAMQLNELVQYSLEAHKRAEITLDDQGRLDEKPAPTNKRIMTCIYLEIAMMAFKRFDRSFSILREAITMLQVRQVMMRDRPAPPADFLAYQRLYREAWIHERFLTITSGYPSVLAPLVPARPAADPNTPMHIEAGFNRLIHLFSILDDTFLASWHGHDNTITAGWIEAKQVQLDQDEIDAAEAERDLWNRGHTGLSERQHADLFITRLWLRTSLWQLALSNGFLRFAPSRDTHEGLSLLFPVQRLTTQLHSLVSRLDSIASISSQGSGILQKLFEVTSTIADVLALYPARNQEDGGWVRGGAATTEGGGSGSGLDSHIEDFGYVARFLLSFEGVRETQKVYLREKLEMLHQSHVVVGFIDWPPFAPST
ncbi:uncharacterized protein ALTATR162_LOCUS10949 [Alternaria atra]|uniref:Transcription factor domain-containing protein n=1 Tax=Alternaria atra TaxID=119953 RepID=A0A8J2IAZ5_9PLEO|nr:uncharacterized protein ALTATR162_LOCUS10949 [Alternaria atra]CAG5184518.1 unnamed protein product [Alternaria atra]